MTRKKLTENDCRRMTVESSLQSTFKKEHLEIRLRSTMRAASQLQERGAKVGDAPAPAR